MKKRNILLLFLSVFSATFFAQNVKISEELNYLNYLMSDAYAGYDDNVEAGIDIPKLISNVQERYENLAQDNEKINQELFAQCIDEGLLRNVVPDNHLYLTLNNKSYGVTSNHYQYSFVFIEKKNNKYIVNYSLEDNVRKGSEYTGSIENLFLEYDNKGEYYRLGVLSPKREEYLETSFNNCTVQIPLYTDAVIQKQNWIGTKHTDKTFYISIGDFVLNTGDAVKHDQQLLTLKKYLSEIQKKEYENIVVDIRGNSGGIENNALPILFAIDSATTYIQQQKFTQKIRTLRNGEKDYFSTPINGAFYNYYCDNPGISISNLDYFKNTKEEKRYQITTFEDNDYKTNYKGKIIILTNTNTASAAELFVMDASLFENVIILGTNTMGGLDFGSNLLYELPNSKIIVSLSAASFTKADALQKNPNWHGDTMGFFPDYWTPNYRLLSTLIDITKDKKLKKVLQGLDDDLL